MAVIDFYTQWVNVIIRPTDIVDYGLGKNDCYWNGVMVIRDAPDPFLASAVRPDGRMIRPRNSSSGGYEIV